jgi:PIN domain nuclease of toxin-antitoxin system
MNLLLDTHILVWARLSPKRLSNRVARALDDSRNEWWISPVSFLEIATLSRKGRVRLPQVPGTWMTETIVRASAHEAPFTSELATVIDTFTLPHSDPIDIIMVATAKGYGLTLVTADRNLIAAKACSVLSNL